VKRYLPLVIGAAVLLTAGLWFFFRSKPRDYALAARAVATRRLAEHLGEKFPGTRVLLISNPFIQNASTSADIVATENAGIEGFGKGMANKLALEAIAFPELKTEARGNPRDVFIDAETTTPLSFLVAEDSFDKLAEQHPQCGLFVSLIGLPRNVKEQRCWQQDNPRFALLLPDLRFVGNVAAVKQAVQKGKIAAMVLQKPGAPSVHGGVSEKEFDQLFILVTPENIDQAILDYPQLFPPN
jgi:hypothetical protein